MIVDPGDHRELGSIDQAHATHDVDLPKLHGP
jgi:hypothetical protein